MSVSGISDSSTSLSPEMLARMRGSGAPPDPSEFASSFIEDKDSDGDGLLSLEEAGVNEEHFLSVDTDGDGFMSEEEIQADVEQRQQQMAAMGELGVFMQGMSGESLANSLIAELDADGDGSLNTGETGLTEELFGSLDADGDGQISEAELAAAMQPPADIGTTPAASAEASQTASTAGATGGSESASGSSESDEEYDEYDYNEDGTVSSDELLQAFLNGDMSLQEFMSSGGSQDSQSPFMRMAMNAYQFQSRQFAGADMLLSMA